MTLVPTFATRPSFLGIERSNVDAAICVAGIPFDLGTSNRPGARFGPAAIRQASRMLVDGDHPASWAEVERLDLADIGDFGIAHGDTWPESFGLAWGHGSPFYHAIEEGLVDPHRMIQIGIRSPVHREIFDW